MNPFRLCIPAFASALFAITPTTWAEGLDFYFNSFGWNNVYKVDADTWTTERKTSTDIGDSDFTSSADFGSDGRLYLIGANNDLIAVDVSGDDSVWTHLYAVNEPGSAFTFAPDGSIWVADSNTIWQLASDGSTVAGSQFQPMFNGSGVSMRGIEFDDAGRLYVVDRDELFEVDPTTGNAVRLAEISGLTPGGILSDLDVGDDGKIRILGSFDYVYEYNPQSGGLEVLPNELLYEGDSFSPSSFATTRVPEPGAGLILAGLAGLTLAGRRRDMRGV